MNRNKSANGESKAPQGPGRQSELSEEELQRRRQKRDEFIATSPQFVKVTAEELAVGGVVLTYPRRPGKKESKD